MRHAAGDKNKQQGNSRESDSFTDKHARVFANSAYRDAKQRGFLTGNDVLKSIQTDEEFINSLNMPSFASIAKLGRL